MCTPVLLFALSSLLSPMNRMEGPNWLNDYATARQKGMVDRKPLAVFVGSGQSGWEKLAKEGKLDKETERVLAAHYICVYVDTQTKAGRRLASALDVDIALGLIISDASGDYMAFHHEGDLNNQALERYLKRYADPNRELISTETNPARPVREPQLNWSPSVRSTFSTGRQC